MDKQCRRTHSLLPDLHRHHFQEHRVRSCGASKHAAPLSALGEPCPLTSHPPVRLLHVGLLKSTPKAYTKPHMQNALTVTKENECKTQTNLSTACATATVKGDVPWAS
eukprot:scpid103843/ scgid30424/ 